MVATIIVLSNLAGVAVQFLYQFIGSAVNSEMISGLWENKLINVVTCLAFLAIATYIAYRGIDTTEHVQIVLVSFQLVILLPWNVLHQLFHDGVALDALSLGVEVGHDAMAKHRQRDLADVFGTHVIATLE